MLQRYKLRLGDGTVLTADLDGLRTWLTDGRATVQVSGTQEWRPLRQFLADEESAARLARALVPPEPRRAPAPLPSGGPAAEPPGRALHRRAPNGAGPRGGAGGLGNPGPSVAWLAGGCRRGRASG